MNAVSAVSSKFGTVFDIGLKSHARQLDRENILCRLGKDLYEKGINVHKDVRVLHRLDPKVPFITIATNHSGEWQNDLDAIVLATILKVRQTNPLLVVNIDTRNKWHTTNDRIEVPLSDGQHSNYFDFDHRYTGRGNRHVSL